MSQTVSIANFRWKVLIETVWSQKYFNNDSFKPRESSLFKNVYNFNFSPSNLSIFVLVLLVTYVTSTITVSKSLRKPGSKKSV